MFHHMDDHGWLGMGWGWLIGLLLIVLLVWVLVRISGRRKAERSPLEILKERYAKGEISEEEYEERKAKL